MKIHRKSNTLRAYRRMGKQYMQQKLLCNIFYKFSKIRAVAEKRIIEISSALDGKLIQVILLQLNENLLNSYSLIQFLIQALSAAWRIVGCASWYPAVVEKVRCLPLLLCHICQPHMDVLGVL